MLLHKRVFDAFIFQMRFKRFIIPDRHGHFKCIWAMYFQRWALQMRFKCIFNVNAAHIYRKGSTYISNINFLFSFFAKRPHVASTPRTFAISDEIYRRFQEYGFKPSFHNYTTILAYSKRDDPNYVYVKEGNGNQL